MSFAAAIKAFEEKALLKANDKIIEAATFIATENIKATQKINLGGLSNGDMANNWHISYGALNVPIPNGPDLSGSASFARVSAMAKIQDFYRKDSTIYITNAMPYSFRANSIGWPQGKGTNGWVWTGKIKAYGFLGQAINNLKGKYM